MRSGSPDRGGPPLDGVPTPGSEETPAAAARPPRRHVPGQASWWEQTHTWFVMIQVRRASGDGSRKGGGWHVQQEYELDYPVSQDMVSLLVSEPRPRRKALSSKGRR
eukprot:gene8031-1263_t